MKLAIPIIAFWLTCGFLAWGITLGELRSDHHDSIDCRHDQSFAVIWGVVGGPVSLAISLASSGFAEHGAQWTCPKVEQ